MNPCLIRIPRTGSTSIIKALGRHYDHYPASVVKKEMGQDWDKAFKFTIVRNPYTRFISMFKEFVKDGTSLADFMEREMYKDSVLFLPQVYYLDEPIDYIGRFEELDKSWAYISGKLELNVELPHTRASKPSQLRLSDKHEEAIHKFYLRDFKVFNYQ